MHAPPLLAVRPHLWALGGHRRPPWAGAPAAPTPLRRGRDFSSIGRPHPKRRDTDNARRKWAASALVRYQNEMVRPPTSKVHSSPPPPPPPPPRRRRDDSSSPPPKRMRVARRPRCLRQVVECRPDVSPWWADGHRACHERMNAAARGRRLGTTAERRRRATGCDRGDLRACPLMRQARWATTRAKLEGAAAPQTTTHLHVDAVPISPAISSPTANASKAP